MPTDTKKQYRYHRKDKTSRNYKKKCQGKSVFDDDPLLTVHSYRVPNSYANAVNDVLTAFRSGISFNKAVDQVAALNHHTINRNRLAEHTLRFIANDY